MGGFFCCGGHDEIRDRKKELNEIKDLKELHNWTTRYIEFLDVDINLLKEKDVLIKY